MKRRTFVGGTLAGIAALHSPVRGAKAPAGEIPTRLFGKTGEKLTIVGQAGGRFPFNFSLGEYKSFDDLLSLIIREPLEKLFPKHLQVKTMMPLSSTASVNELIEKFTEKAKA